MGFFKKVKNLGKKAVKAVTAPENLLNMGASAFLFGKDLYGDYRDDKKERKEKKDAEAVAQQAQIKAEEEKVENEFLKDLEEKRASSKKTRVIFAGLLGGAKKIGLGGQKSLLGL